jgi:hypothetical protein
MSYFDTVTDANVRSGAYFIAHAVAQCEACTRSTRVIALALPADHDAAELAENPEPPHEDQLFWWPAPLPAWVFFINDISAAAQQRLRAAARGYRRVRTQTADDSYWGNHCEHCGAALDDHELYCEPGGAFMPMNPSEAAGIRLERVAEPIDVAAAGYASEPELFRYMPRS